MILVVMGVSGSGKTTIGKMLASETGWPFADGDDYHPQANKDKMHAGVPLNDEDRAPWLLRLHGLLLSWKRKGENGILACSALKEQYRRVLSTDLPDLRFVLLEAPVAVLEERLRARTAHFMNPDLLASQFATLEVPTDALRVSVTQPAAEVVRFILRELKA